MAACTAAAGGRARACGCAAAALASCRPQRGRLARRRHYRELGGWRLARPLPPACARRHELAAAPPPRSRTAGRRPRRVSAAATTAGSGWLPAQLLLTCERERVAAPPPRLQAGGPPATHRGCLGRRRLRGCCCHARGPASRMCRGCAEPPAPNRQGPLARCVRLALHTWPLPPRAMEPAAAAALNRRGPLARCTCLALPLPPPKARWAG